MKSGFLIKLLFLVLLAIGMFLPSITAETSLWYPASVPWNDTSKTIIHVGKMVLDAPAGKYGFLKVKQGHFYFENGQRIRFWGANISAEGNFPPHQTAEKLAGHLAKFGFNIIRLHHMDSSYAPRGILDKSSGNTQILSREQLDKLDYLIYQLKKHGIYVDINLHVGRKFTVLDGVADAKNLPRNSKQVTLFDRRLIELQKDYARQLLTHYNPYIKTRYCDEPCVALVETTNENTLFSAWTNGALFGETDEALPESYRHQLDQLWNQWLIKKYQTRNKLENAWLIGSRPDGSNLVTNSDFEGYLDGWVTEAHLPLKANVERETVNPAGGVGALRITSLQSGTETYQLQIKQLGIRLMKDVKYRLRFKAKADQDTELSLGFGKNTSPWTNFGLNQHVTLSNDWQEYNVFFTAKTTTDGDTRLSFGMGKMKGTVWLDEIELCQTGINGLQADEKLAQKNIARTPWPARFAFTERRLADNVQFYQEIEQNYFREMQDYLHKKIVVKVPVATTNNYYGLPNLLAQNEGDYIDAHGYWDHPAFPGKRFDAKDFKQHNQSLIANPEYSYKKGSAFNSSPIFRFTLSAMADKPLVISEWNDVYPNGYDYEEAGMLTAYALFQDWDGLFIYTLCHSLDDLTTEKINSWFNVINNPGKMAQMPACSLAFIRGDFQPARKTLFLRYSRSDIFNRYREMGGDSSYHIPGLPSHTAYIHAVRKQFNDQSSSTSTDKLWPLDINQSMISYSSDTQEITWNYATENQQYLLLNTDHFQGAIGFIKGLPIKTLNLECKLTTNGSLFLSAMDHQPIGLSRHLLLTLVAGQRNTDQLKNNQSGLANWGKAPTLMEAIEGEIKVSLEKIQSNYRVYPLDATGNRFKEIPTNRSGKTLQFEIRGVPAFWYEIAVN